MSPTNRRPIAGFRTEQGSLYRYDQSDSTSERLKLSAGVGQGEWHDKSMCLFVDPAQFEEAKDKFGVPGVSLKFAYYSPDMKTLTMLGNSLSDVPPGQTPAVIFFDNLNKQAVAALAAQTEPVVGMMPVEKKYNPNGTSYTHAGHAVVSVEKSPFVFDLHVQTALADLKTPPPPLQTQFLTRSASSPPSKQLENLQVSKVNAFREGMTECVGRTAAIGLGLISGELSAKNVPDLLGQTARAAISTYRETYKNDVATAAWYNQPRP